MSDLPPDYVEELAWADLSCATIGRSPFDVSIFPVSWSHSNGTSRLDPLLRLLRAANDPGASFSRVMDNGGTDDIRNYFQDIGVIIGTPIVFAALALIFCGPLLWLSRCCAHRCCRHSAKPYSDKAQRIRGGCCVVMGLLTICFLVIGALAGSNAVPAIQQTVSALISHHNLHLSSPPDRAHPRAAMQHRLLLPQHHHLLQRRADAGHQHHSVWNRWIRSSDPTQSGAHMHLECPRRRRLGGERLQRRHLRRVLRGER